MKLFTGAKINISLKILNQRNDGYHGISTVFQELDFGDEITIERIKKGCQFSSNVNWLKNDESNLCVQAWMKMKSLFPQVEGVKITLKKQIPSGAGLGGGSSNAGGMIKGLNTLFELNLSTNDMEVIASQIGADVPFFIQGGTQKGEGIGDILTVLSQGIKGTVLLVIPEVHISTNWAYSMIKNKLDNTTESPNFVGFFQDNYFPETIFKNDFEKLIFPAYPEISRIKTTLIDLGAIFAGLSGSGSTVYGIFNDHALIKSAELHFKSSYQTIIANPIPSSA